MKLLKLSNFFMFGLTLAATIVTSIYVNRKKQESDLRDSNVDSISETGIKAPGNVHNESEKVLNESSINNHRDGDARHDKNELKKNQERLHVGANHKTKEMEQHNRGTFP